MPIPAEAKLAPFRRLSPFSCGLKYGNTDSPPIPSPDNNQQNMLLTEVHA